MSKSSLLSPIYLISESIFEAGDITLLQESDLGNTGLKKIRFKAKLQEKDVVNNNNRRYSDAALRVITGQLAPKATERKLLGEMDHPTPQGDDRAKLKRSSTISLKEACVLYTNISYDGKFIIGECETITGGRGPDMFNYLRDRVVFGFSLRAFGSTSQTNDGIIEVLPNNLKALTFDVVSNPSHSNSVITEILNENSQPANTLELIKMLEEVKAMSNEMLLTENENGILVPMSAMAKGISTGLLEESQTICDCIGDACLSGTIEESIDFLLKQTSTNLTNNLRKFKF